MALSLYDKTGNGNNLTNVGATEVTTDLPFVASVKAAALDGSQYLYAIDSPSLSITGSLTLELWVNFASLPGSDVEYTIINKKTDSGSKYSYHFGLWNQSGTLKLHGFYQPTAEWNEGNRKTVAWTPSTDTWYHLALSLDMSVPEMRFYVNGSLQGLAQSTTSNSIYNSDVWVEIGSQNEGTASHVGRVDDIRIWDDVRTATEINDNKGVELIGNEPNLVAYWPFESFISPFPSHFNI